MQPSESNKCFVIMPFGVKTLKDGSGRKYDFDKVYRVIIKRAVRLTGMEPIRADAKLAGDSEYVDIGRRQYTLLRRFIEHYLGVLRNQALIGQVSRALQLRPPV